MADADGERETHTVMRGGWACSQRGREEERGNKRTTDREKGGEG